MVSSNIKMSSIASYSSLRLLSGFLKWGADRRGAPLTATYIYWRQNYPYYLKVRPLERNTLVENDITGCMLPALLWRVIYAIIYLSFCLCLNY